MNKAFKMGKVSATGSVHLWIGTVVSYVIMAVGTIILARLMSPAEYGLYSIALIPPLMISLFRDWGVNMAVTKYVAHSAAKGDVDTARRIISAGLFFELGTGFTLTVISIFLAGFIASTFLGRPELTSLTSIASGIIIAGSLLVVSQSSFTGLERMGLKSLTMICQAVVKALVAPLLVFFGFGVLGAVLGYILALFIAGIAGSMMLYFVLFRRENGRAAVSPPNVSKTLKSLLRYGMPLSVSNIITGTQSALGFLPLFYNFLIAFYCTDAVVGNYKATTNFAVLLTFFTSPLITVLFPAFAKVDSRNEKDLLKTVFKSSVKYSALIVVPVATAVIVLSEPLVFTLIGHSYNLAPYFLSLSIIGFLSAGFGSLSVNSLLAGLGETKTLMKLGILTLLIGVPLSVILTPYLGVVGAIIAGLAGNFLNVLFGLKWLRRRHKVSVDWGSSGKIFIASSIAGLITFLSASYLVSVEWVRLLVGGIIFVAIYVIMVPLLGAISIMDVNNLRIIFSDMAFVSRLLSLPLNAMEKLLRMKLKFSSAKIEPRI